MATLLLIALLSAVDEPKARSLFDGKTLDGWQVAEFGGDGRVMVEDGRIVLETGATLTGITYKKGEELPKSNYEITCEAMRVDGSDFFCGLTFPVKDSHCSFIVGGWGGAVVGISSVDGKDASENDTTKYMKFDKGRWYRIRIRVTDDVIACWIDDEQVVDQKLEGRKITTRNEVNLSKPLGFSAWQTTAALRGIKLQTLK
jgi:hypothetical protein